MKSFFAALQFLTTIPIPKRLVDGPEALKKSIFFFPAVGLLIGLLAAGADIILELLMPPLPVCVLVVILLVFLTGGLHMDRLSDTADGFMSSRHKDRILEIMKDSRIGAMGTLAIVFAVYLKISLLSSLSGTIRWKAIILMPLAGRTAIVLMMGLLPYLRGQKGIVTVLQGEVSYVHMAWVLLILFAVGWLVSGRVGIYSGICSTAVTVCFIIYSNRRIGGFTGDTLGAICEIT